MAESAVARRFTDGAVDALGRTYRHLTHEERLEVIRQLRALRAEILAERGGMPIPVEEIDQALEAGRGGQ